MAKNSFFPLKILKSKIIPNHAMNHGEHVKMLFMLSWWQDHGLKANFFQQKSIFQYFVFGGSWWKWSQPKTNSFSHSSTQLVFYFSNLCQLLNARTRDWNVNSFLEKKAVFVGRSLPAISDRNLDNFFTSKCLILVSQFFRFNFVSIFSGQATLSLSLKHTQE